MSLFNREKFNADLAGLIKEFGISIFDIDYPSLSSPTLRVFICKDGNDFSAEQKNSDRAVNVDDCARVSRAISTLLEEQQIEEADQWALEVSSPGINRKLRLLQHFSGAVGERVLITFSDQATGHRENIVGEIVGVEDRNIILFKNNLTTGKKGARKKSKSSVKGKDLTNMSQEDLLTIPFDCVEDARVDFVF